jgi:protein O-GlcNAc transferase
MAVLTTDLEAASKLARAGRFGDAAGLYRELLARDPEHPEAIHFLGICLVRSG